MEQATEYFNDPNQRSSTESIARFVLGNPGISYSLASADAYTGLGGAHTHTVSGSIENAGSATPMSVKQPSLAVMFIIKT